MEKARLMIDEPATGAWNMSVDHALLETANATGRISIRVYQWSEPTLSLGYFQSHLQRHSHSPSLDCPMVRRSTGGGAIVHDREITYSLCVPSSNRWAKSNEQLYYLVHELIVDLLAQQNIHAELFDGCLDEFDAHAFLCFQRRSKGDIVIGDDKICGSAQRRKKNALIQHGSLLLGVSNQAPELPGLKEAFFEDQILKEALIRNFSLELASRLGVELSVEALDACELSVAEQANTRFYAVEDWNKQR